MKKKIYVTPSCYIHTCTLNTTFLHGSDHTDKCKYDGNGNEYWHDTHKGESGNPYWHGAKQSSLWEDDINE